MSANCELFRALLQQGGKDWPVSRVPGEKGFLQVAYICSIVLFHSGVLKEKWPCLFSVRESMDILSLSGFLAVDTQWEC